MSSTPAPAFVQKIARLTDHLSTDLFGGPKLVKAAWVINVQKGGTLPFVAFLMWYYGNTSTAAWVYLALHGSYGLCWLLKHFVFPDPNWEKKVTFGGAFAMVAAVLGPYWTFPWLLISGVLGPAHSGATWVGLSFAIVLHTLGVVTMMISDAQKYFTLAHRRGLIQTGMFRYIRHPNYLGEMMLYGAYAVVVAHWIPWVVLAYVWTYVFMTNMLMKEASMSRYPEWADYKARTGMLLPKPWARLGSAEPAPASVGNIDSASGL